MSIAGRTIHKVNSWATPDFDIKDPSLVLYLPLWYPDSETTGSTIISKDINRRSCSVTGAIWTPQGRYFDGTDDTIVTATNIGISGQADRTIEIWAKPSADGLAVNWGTFNNYQHWALQAQTGTWRCSDGAITLDSTKAYSSTVFQHVVCTYTGSDDIAKIFVDAVQYGGSLQFSDNVNTLDSPVKIGERVTVNTFDYAGIIGEVRIYSRALTLSEVQRNYLATKWRYV